MGGIHVLGNGLHTTGAGSLADGRRSATALRNASIVAGASSTADIMNDVNTAFQLSPSSPSMGPVMGIARAVLTVPLPLPLPGCALAGGAGVPYKRFNTST